MTPVTLIVLFLGSVVAAAISGAVGFGGALLLLPLLTRMIGPELAVPLLTFAQLVGNVSRALFGIRSIAWRPVLAFLVTAMPAALLGSFCFLALPKSSVTRVIGVALLVFVALRASGVLQIAMNRNRLASAGLLVGFLSGLVGSAGPLGSAVFLALDLSPAAYIASEATAAVAMHAVKLVAYTHAEPFGGDAKRLAVLLSVGMILGSWLGKKTVERLSPATFRRVVGGLLVAVGLQMAIVG